MKTNITLIFNSFFCLFSFNLSSHFVLSKFFGFIPYIYITISNSKLLNIYLFQFIYKIDIKLYGIHFAIFL